MDRFLFSLDSASDSVPDGALLVCSEDRSSVSVESVVSVSLLSHKLLQTLTSLKIAEWVNASSSGCENFINLLSSKDSLRS